MENQLDNLLNEKFDRDRVADWKKKIPMPPAESQVTKSNKKFLLILAASFIFLMSVFAICIFTRNNIDKIVDTYIQNTPVAFFDDLNQRSSGRDEIALDENQLSLYKGIEALKSESPRYSEVIKQLESVTLSKNKYQVEALWFKALAHAKIKEYEIAVEELEKLMALSNYKNDKAKKLINLIHSK